MSRVSCCVVLAGLLVSGVQAASAQQQSSLAISPTDSASAFSRQAGRRLVFICPAIDEPSRSVWGNGTYADDSSICSAAIHAGFLSFGRVGLVAIVIGGIVGSFEGSERNGVRSESYANGDYSYTFSRNTGPADIDWTTNALRTPAEFTEPVTVLCPAGGNTSDFIWGTDTYISDSAICVAAVHAGVITLDGGAVTVTRAPGRDTFESTLQNGVQSIGWTAWTDAFRVSAGQAVAGTESTDSSDRVIRLAGYTGSGNGVDIVPRTIRLGGYAGTGSGPDIVSRRIRIGGWNGTGTAP